MDTGSGLRCAHALPLHWGYYNEGFRHSVRAEMKNANPSFARIVANARGSSKDLQPISNQERLRLDCGIFLAALSLLGAGAVAAFAGKQRNSHFFASVTTTEITQQNKDAVNNEGGSNTMNEDLRRDYEQWKTVPYAPSVPLRIVGLRGSVPPVWIKDFILAQGKRMRVGAEFQGSLDKIYTQLSSEKQSGRITARSVMAADAVTLGESWLGAAINSKLVVPVGKPEELDWFQYLNPKWQRFLQRDEKGYPSDTGDVWGAPYRCGCMVIAYRKDKLKKAGLSGIKDWEDLWRPELTGRISMVESTREVVGMVLKSLKASYNSKDFDKEVDGGKEAVKNRFQRLRKQVRVFDNVNYLKALGAGDVWVAVGWSVDVLPFAKRSSNVAVVAPASGTSLWADIWAIPATSSIQSNKVGGRVRGPSPLVSQWLDFCLQPARSLAFYQEAFSGASPLRISAKDEEAPSQTGPQLETNLVSGLPPRKILDRSEFLEPLDAAAVAQYHWLLETNS